MYFSFDKPNPDNEIKRTINISSDKGVIKPGMVGLRAEEIDYPFGVQFDYILVAPYDPDIKVNY